MCEEAFWADPDIRWLAGVNESSSTTWFNKEQFEELLSWIQLPALLRIARHDKFKPAVIGKIESGIEKACTAAHDAGYKLDAFLKLASLDHVEKEPAAKGVLS